MRRAVLLVITLVTFTGCGVERESDGRDQRKSELSERYIRCVKAHQNDGAADPQVVHDVCVEYAEMWVQEY